MIGRTIDLYKTGSMSVNILKRLSVVIYYNDRTLFAFCATFDVC